MKNIIDNAKYLLKSLTLYELMQGLKVTLKYMFKRKITIQFPEAKTPISTRFRGILALRKDEHGVELCIACKLCEAVCPAQAITIESTEADDGTRRTTKYDIDMFKCINCGLCEEACPVDAVVVTPIQHYHMENRGENIMTKEKLLKIGDMYEKELSENIEINKQYR